MEKNNENLLHTSISIYVFAFSFIKIWGMNTQDVCTYITVMWYSISPLLYKVKLIYLDEICSTLWSISPKIILKYTEELRTLCIYFTFLNFLNNFKATIDMYVWCHIQKIVRNPNTSITEKYNILQFYAILWMLNMALINQTKSFCSMSVVLCHALQNKAT